MYLIACPAPGFQLKMHIFSTSHDQSPSSIPFTPGFLSHAHNYISPHSSIHGAPKMHVCLCPVKIVVVAKAAARRKYRSSRGSASPRRPIGYAPEVLGAAEYREIWLVHQPCTRWREGAAKPGWKLLSNKHCGGWVWRYRGSSAWCLVQGMDRGLDLLGFGHMPPRPGNSSVLNGFGIR